MKIKTAELAGAMLDYWVDKALGNHRQTTPQMEPMYKFNRYSSDWQHGGPIIEREQIPLCPVMGGTWQSEYVSWRGEDDCDTTTVYGPTPLVAAMRAYVCSVFGDEVPNAEAE